MSDADADNRALAASALEKRRVGQQPNQKELAALRRIEREREVQLRQQYYRTVPQRDYREMSGRQPKILQEQAIRYGLPIGGKTVDLYAAIRAYHDFFAKYAKLLPADGDELLIGPGSEALEDFRRARAKQAWLTYQQQLGEWVRVADVDATLVTFAHVMRTACETLQRIYGDDAHALMDGALVDALRAVQALLGAECATERGSVKP